ncbi:MAG: DUF262 domain-containing protein [Candidatus Magnetoovum sp. WYHC-5]|nr:DUF262 domain-containing protein [Candidatus Magnetoovum sp. WYHC-5]
MENKVIYENNTDTIFDDDSQNEPREGYGFDEYEITATPSDFNIATLFSFIESGVVTIPGFQRNYVWDHGRASKLIESLIIGLPVPQIFLYEQSRNKFLIIDGQQRMMSIYYFIKEIFPKMEKRAALRKIFAKHNRIPDEILNDNKYYSDFSLYLPTKLPKRQNKLHGLTYSTLDEYKVSFDLRTIRNVIIKQMLPKDDDSSIYEIFNRLNTGGVNLTDQEIRMSLHHSDFMNMLSRVNANSKWRKLIKLDEPDIHMKDIEILLRAFAMLIKGDNYTPSMLKFLNGFAKDKKTENHEQISYLETLFYSFLDSCSLLQENIFLVSSNRFSITLFESVFYAACYKPYLNTELISGNIDNDSIIQLKNNETFKQVSIGKTTNTQNVKKRLHIALDIVKIK